MNLHELFMNLREAEETSFCKVPYLKSIRITLLKVIWLYKKHIQMMTCSVNDELLILASQNLKSKRQLLATV